MNTFNYTAEISSATTLLMALIGNGADASATTIACIPKYSLGIPTGEMIVTIETMSSSSICDASILDSLTGSLLSNKENKKKEVSIKSTSLIKKGLSHTTASGNSGVFPIERSKEELSFYNTIVDALGSNPLEAPQIIPTVNDGEGVKIENLSEAVALSDDARHRMEYIFTSPSSNYDLSKSQLLLDAEIDLAVSQAELDAVVDTRS